MDLWVVVVRRGVMLKGSILKGKDKDCHKEIRSMGDSETCVCRPDCEFVF